MRRQPQTTPHFSNDTLPSLLCCFNLANSTSNFTFHVGSEGASRDVLNWSSIAPNLHPRPQGSSTISSPSFGPSRTSVLRGPATDMPARHATNRQGSSQNRSKPFWTLEKQVWLCDWAAQKVALSLDTGGKDKSNPLSTQCSQPQVETG